MADDAGAVLRRGQDLHRDGIRIGALLLGVGAEPAADRLLWAVRADVDDLNRVPLAHHRDLLLDRGAELRLLGGIGETREERLRTAIPRPRGEERREARRVRGVRVAVEADAPLCGSALDRR